MRLGTSFLMVYSLTPLTIYPLQSLDTHFDLPDGSGAAVIPVNLHIDAHSSQRLLWKTRIINVGNYIPMDCQNPAEFSAANQQKYVKIGTTIFFLYGFSAGLRSRAIFTRLRNRIFFHSARSYLLTCFMHGSAGDPSDLK